MLGKTLTFLFSYLTNYLAMIYAYVKLVLSKHMSDIFYLFRNFFFLFAKVNSRT